MKKECIMMGDFNTNLLGSLNQVSVLDMKDDLM